MAINVDTSKVVSTANTISAKNTAIKNDFKSVETAIRQLNTSWNGSASEGAIGAFDNIKNSYCDTRYTVVNDLVKFMLEQVGERYDTTETKLCSAASAFK